MGMKVLVVGSGGREHAIVRKIAGSKRVKQIYCAPGNGGISRIAECVPCKATDVQGIIRFSRDKAIDLVFVAPDDPLALGMVDELEKNGIRAFGPRGNAAAIESSKVFSKNLMKKYNIPTASFETFRDPEKAIEYLKSAGYPIVIKADGLALGKGVIIADCFDEAKAAVVSIMEQKVFGASGNEIVIEEFLKGPEVTVLAFVDGKNVVPMVSSQDHKRALDGDRGLNTGGMGAFSPSRIYGCELERSCMRDIFLPTVKAMESEGRAFKGCLYFGLMITQDGPKVIEYNARFGDPETQVILPRLKNDIIDVIDAVIDGKLDKIDIEWDDRPAVCVVMASGGYPSSYRTGFEISGIEEAEEDDNVTVYHAGTRYEGGRYYTAGGRVLGVTAMDDSFEAAVDRAYAAVGKIRFENMHFRKDIGRKDI